MDTRSSSRSLGSAGLGVNRRRIVRAALTLSLLGSMLVTAAVGQSPTTTRAQSTSAHAAAGVTPATAVLYADIVYDVNSAQWKQADVLLKRLGSTGIESALKSDGGSGGGLMGSVRSAGLEGGELALVVTNLDTVSAQSGNLGALGGLAKNLPIATPTATSSGSPSGIAVIAKPVTMATAQKSAKASLQADAAAADAKVETTTYKDVSIEAIPANATSGASGQALATVGDFIVYAEAPVDIQPIIDTHAGVIKPLNGVDAFKKVGGEFKGDRVLFGYINGSALGGSLNGLDTSGMGITSSLGGLLGTQNDTGFTLAAADAGFRIDTVELPTDGSVDAKAGGAAKDLTLAKSVPADSTIFVNGYNLGSGSLLQSLGLVLVSALSGVANGGTPTAVPTADSLYASAAQLLGFNLKADFIDQMVGQYAFALWNVDPANPAKISAVLASGVKSPAALSNTVGSLSFLIQAAAQGRANVTTKTVGDSVLNSVAFGDPAAPITIDYGVLKDRFVLGVGDGATTFGKGVSNSLADSTTFKAALAELPTEYDGVFYANLQQILGLTNSLSSLGTGGSQQDANADCGKYPDQAAAQKAHDADPISNVNLDQNFNGKACEDFYVSATPEASPIASAYSALSSSATVSFKSGGLART
ncbi:MAG: DUF3352 domain-containing protein, partial [Thermomicrobiales bacterium]